MLKVNKMNNKRYNNPVIITLKAPFYITKLLNIHWCSQMFIIQFGFDHFLIPRLISGRI